YLINVMCKTSKNAGPCGWQAIIPTCWTKSVTIRSTGTTTMLTHAQIWTALDRLAARAGLSASGLAKKAGLDPTTFNKSKRITPDGRQRWPSTESVAKSLAATATHIDRKSTGLNSSHVKISYAVF